MTVATVTDLRVEPRAMYAAVRRSFLIRDLVAGVLAAVRLRHPHVSVRWSVEYQAGLQRECSCDAGTAGDILTELLSNAARFTHNFRSRLVVRPDNRDGSPVVCFDVIDSGPGLDRETRRRIFERGGSLTQARRLARFVGGSLEVHSRRRHGSRFTLTLPA